MKLAKLILRKAVKIVATRGQILRLKCTKIDFGWGSAPDPMGELTALSLAGIKGPYFQGKGWRKEGNGKEREGMEEGNGGEGRTVRGGRGRGAGNGRRKEGKGKRGRGKGEEEGEKERKGRLAIPILICFRCHRKPVYATS